MSETAIIHAVFDEVFGRSTDFSSFDDRLEAQKIVYLLDELGVTCGDFPFKWYKHGPYSQRPQNAILENYDNNERVSFSPAGKKAIETIKQIITEPHSEYSDSQWLEAIGSIQYLQKYLYSTSQRDAILKRLNELKPHLDNKGLNSNAYTILEKYSLL